MAKKKITDRTKPHCLREAPCYEEPMEPLCRRCGFWSTEAERRRGLPLKQDPETGLARKYVGRQG